VHPRRGGPKLSAIVCDIIPPHILRSIAEHGDAVDRERAHLALEMSAHTRGEREGVARLAAKAILAPSLKRRTVFDANHTRELPGRLVRAEGQRRVRDVAANEAYDGAGKTHDFFRRVHERNSVDDRGLPLDATVHYGADFVNAQWNGRQMMYGDGDGKYFRRFTTCLDVIAHELTHGVSQYSAAFEYEGQSGALSEHFSDVFGSLVKQYAKKQTASRADWLIGRGLFTRRVCGEAVRSMKAPGTAYDDPVIGRDPQPSHMKKYRRMQSDHGGVHVNSGIPNHAFYQVATLVGGRAWEVAGKIWYRALTHKLTPRAQFRQCADATWEAAGELFGFGSAPQEAVLAGWRAVGITISRGVIDRGPRLRVREEEEFTIPIAGAELPQMML